MLRHGIFLYISMVRLSIILALFTLISCKQQPAEEPETLKVIEADLSANQLIEEKKKTVPSKILWVHKSIANDISIKQDVPILLFIFDNRFKESMFMDMKSLSDSSVAEFVNTNFVAVRSHFSEFNGQLPPSSLITMIKYSQTFISFTSIFLIRH